jgi:hypothetical protein
MDEKIENSTPLYKKPIFEASVIVAVVFISVFILGFFTLNTKPNWKEYQVLDYLVEYPNVPMYRSAVAKFKFGVSSTSTVDLSVNVEVSLSYNKDLKSSFSVSQYFIDRGAHSNSKMLSFLLNETVKSNRLVISTSSEIVVSGYPAIDFISTVPLESKTVQGRIIAVDGKGIYVLMGMCAEGCDQTSYQKFVTSFEIKK